MSKVFFGSLNVVAQDSSAAAAILNSMTAEDYQAMYEMTKNLRQSEEDYKKMVAQFGVDPNGRHVTRLSDPNFHPTRAKEIAETPIVQYVRGKNGKKFPSAEEIKTLLPTPKIDEAGFKKRFTEQYYPEAIKSVERELEIVNLPECKTDATDRMTIGRGDLKFDQTQMDVLFVQKKFIPNDTISAFGKKVLIRPYSPTYSGGIHQAAKALGAECVPTRFRATNNFYYRLTGKEALKNFDRKPEGQMDEDYFKFLKEVN